MVQINFALKEVNCKIVYYGPGMSGKTTNLEIVHLKAPETHKGELTSIATEGDRTLFFDFMPLDLGTIAGMRTKFQLYTVPGQVYYNSTRKLVLQGVDGVIFVADSQGDKMAENLESMENLRGNLIEYGKKLDEIPMVIQYNKRDLPGALPVDVLNTKLNPLGVPSFEAVATTGEGVFPTLKALSSLVLESLSRMNRTNAAARRRSLARPAATSAAAPGEEAPAAAAAKPRPAAAAAAATRVPAAAAAKARPAAAASAARDAGGGTRSPAPPRSSATSTVTPPREIHSIPGSFARPAAPDVAPPRKKSPERKPETPARPPAGRDGGWTPGTSKPPSFAPASEQKVGKYVLEKERRSALPMVALAGVIALAAAIVLYSLNIF